MKIVLFVLLVLGAVIFVKRPEQSNSTPVAPPVLATTPKETEVKNLDGTHTLILNGDGSIFISDDKGRRFLYSGTHLSLPPNAWAPDNSYVFVKQTEPAVTYLVFKTSGEPFSDTEKYLDVAALFGQKQPQRTLKDATGWDGVGLIHIKSDGPSFWFDVASRSFLQLSR